MHPTYLVPASVLLTCLPPLTKDAIPPTQGNSTRGHTPGSPTHARCRTSPHPRDEPGSPPAAAPGYFSRSKFPSPHVFLSLRANMALTARCESGGCAHSRGAGTDIPRPRERGCCAARRAGCGGHAVRVAARPRDRGGAGSRCPQVETLTGAGAWLGL